MNEEEKQAILKLKRVINKDTGFISDDIQDDEIETILGLINKQQKEIEDYKECERLSKRQVRKLKNDIEALEIVHEVYKEQIQDIEKRYVSKDKIRKEIEEIKNCRLSTCDEQINMSLKERYEIEDEICEYFEELLGD